MATGELDAYLRQWLKTATGDNVTYETAVVTDRLIFTCGKCGATAKCARPENSVKIDYYIREFVNLHAHKGGHTRLDNTTDGSSYKVPFKPISPNAKSLIEQKTIEEQMAKYKTEIGLQKKKMGEAYPGKIIDIGAGLYKEKSWVNGNWGDGGEWGGCWQPHPHTGIPQWVPIPVQWLPADGVVTFPNGTPAAGTLPNNVITFPQQIPYYVPPPAPTPPAPTPAPPAPPKEKALKPKTGRRFR